MAQPVVHTSVKRRVVRVLGLGSLVVSNGVDELAPALPHLATLIAVVMWRVVLMGGELAQRVVLLDAAAWPLAYYGLSRSSLTGVAHSSTPHKWLYGVDSAHL